MKSPPFLFLLFLLYGCSNIVTIEIHDANGRLAEKYEQHKKTEIRQGIYQAFFENGNLKEEAVYDEGELHGIRKFFYESGALLSIEHHDKGQFAGKYQKYYEDGKLYGEGQYENNQMNGIWKRWYPKGELMEEVTFSENAENGPFREYHVNGRLKTEGQYLNGAFEQGELRKYDESGLLYERMYCEEGICMTVWTSEKGNIPIDSSLLKKLVELKNR